LIIDDLMVARSFKNSLFRDLEGVVIDTHTDFNNVGLINGVYDLVITDPMSYATGIMKCDDFYLDTLKGLQSKGAHLCFISTQEKDVIDILIHGIESEHSYALKPLDRFVLTKYVGRFLDVSLKLDRIVDDIPDDYCFGPVFQD